MGKCTRKGKVSGEVVAVMDPPLGVRTRARTRNLALQKPSSDYLELRNRRLEKPSPSSPKTDSGVPGLEKPGLKKSQAGNREERENEEEEEELEFSFIGENVLEANAIDRSTRESTPCNLIIDSDEKCCTPGSTTRHVTTRNRVRDSLHQILPTPVEIEEFFSVAEKLQQRTFMEKYNFDPVNECPLPEGRYEWEKLDC